MCGCGDHSVRLCCRVSDSGQVAYTLDLVFVSKTGYCLDLFEFAVPAASHALQNPFYRLPSIATGLSLFT